MELRFYIRQYQYVNMLGYPIVYTGTSPGALKATSGTVDNVWRDVTKDVNMDKLKLQWTMDRDIQGFQTPGQYNPKKSASGSLLVSGEAYDYIKAWCIDHISAPWNSVEVKIEDTSCGMYESYQIKSQQMAWCEDKTCQFDLNLKQTDDPYTCIQKFTISDNHQGWFQSEPKNGKKHPRFSYCNEYRPNGNLVVVWWLLTQLEVLMVPIIFSLSLAWNSIVFAWNGIVSLINFLGGNANYLDYLDPWNAPEAFEIMFLNSAGCSREHPAPLIRDYITNICDLCGIKVDPVTCPIFFSETIDIQTSTGFKKGVKNPYFNACYFYAPYARGIKRFMSVNWFQGGLANDKDFYIVENRPLLSLDKFLDQLKGVFNAEWRIKGGKLYFWRKDWYTSGQYIYDFTSEEDRAKILEGICFEWNEVTYPAFCRGLYNHDGVDTCGNEALNQMNGLVQFAPDENNPTFKNEMNKIQQEFGGTKFRLDGASTDYIYDTMQTVINGSILSPTEVFIFRELDDKLSDYANYVLLMTDESAGLAKILIWDGESYMNAKCVRDIVPVNNDLVPAPGNETPQINPNYPRYDSNIQPFTLDWWEEGAHPPYVDVKGRALGAGSTNKPGIYEVKDIVGQIIIHNAARLVNYPMYFEPHYRNTLWDWFHYIDDPRANPSMNMNWSVKIELCCEDLERLKVLGDASEIELLEKVKLPIPYYESGIITDIEVSYDDSNQLGKYIGLKGKL